MRHTFSTRPRADEPAQRLQGKPVERRALLMRVAMKPEYEGYGPLILGAGTPKIERKMPLPRIPAFCVSTATTGSRKRQPAGSKNSSHRPAEPHRDGRGAIFLDRPFGSPPVFWRKAPAPVRIQL